MIPQYSPEERKARRDKVMDVIYSIYTEDHSLDDVRPMIRHLSTLLSALERAEVEVESCIRSVEYALRELSGDLHLFRDASPHGVLGQRGPAIDVAVARRHDARAALTMLAISFTGMQMPDLSDNIIVGWNLR